MGRTARGGKSRFHSCTRPISRMPAGSVYFVSFYITRYSRDPDSIYFLLALRHKCTGPIFDVGGRIFSGRNDRWIFLYFPFPHHTSLSSSVWSFSHRELLLRLTATSRSIRRPRARTIRNSIYLVVPELQWIPFPLLFLPLQTKLRF